MCATVSENMQTSAGIDKMEIKGTIAAEVLVEEEFKTTEVVEQHTRGRKEEETHNFETPTQSRTGRIPLTKQETATGKRVTKPTKGEAISLCIHGQDEVQEKFYTLQPKQDTLRVNWLRWNPPTFLF